MADGHVREAEHGKVQMHKLPGQNNFCNFNLNKPKDQEMQQFNFDIQKDYIHSSMVDESYQLIGMHVDQATQDRIIRGEYIDFSRLIPKDQVLTADDNRYEMIVRDGKTFWIPATNHEGTAISNFNRWEQAFRVYSDIYMKAYPHRASELVQYCHLIHTASQSFTWENVYMYNKDFRLHMAKHTKRSWSIILQQAWAVRLKDKIKFAGNSTPRSDRKDLCKRYNRGECTAGMECRYDHRCSYYFKFGHLVIHCRKLRHHRSLHDRDKHDRYDRYRHDRRDGHHRDHHYLGSNGHNRHNHSQTKHGDKKTKKN